MTKPNPLDWGSDCSRCPFSVNKKPRPDYVLGEIPENPVGLLISESPGHEDSALGRPFGGNTGRMLDETLSQAGLSRKDLGVVTATCCKPGPMDGPDQRAQAAKCCKPALMHQVSSHLDKPKLLMGTTATASFTKVVKGGVDAMRGFVRPEINGIVTWGPAYAYFTNPYVWGDFEGDVRRFARLISGQLESPPKHLNTRPTAMALRTLVKHSGGTVAIDIETAPVDTSKPWTGKDPTQAILRSIGFGTETEALSFMWEDADHELQSETKRVLSDPLVTKVLHNGYFFDLRVLRRYGMETVNVEDTRDMRCALSATSGLSLRYVTSIYSDFSAWKEAEDDK